MRNYLIDIVNSIKTKRLIKRLLILCFSLFISALIFNLFQRETGLITGGVAGISMILEKSFGINITLSLKVLMWGFLIISFIFLGVETTSGAIVASIVYPFFVDITEKLAILFPVETTDLLLISIFMGVLLGITNGLVYKNGFSNGGTAIIPQVLYKYFKISISTSSLIMNAIIVSIGGLYFGWQMVMYATIILYINSIVIDKVMLGTSSNKSIYIITTKTSEIKEYIINTLNRGVTEFDVRGGFRYKKKKALMTVIPNNDYFRLKEGIKLIDKNVFFIVTDSYQVLGGK